MTATTPSHSSTMVTHADVVDVPIAKRQVSTSEAAASRARLLALLEAPATTTQAAARLHLAPAAVSAHLKVLHEGGLVSRHRHGREVFYVLTDLGRRLVEHG